MKKRFLGKRFTKSQLKRVLKNIKFGLPIKTMYERREIFPFAFVQSADVKIIQEQGIYQLIQNIGKNSIV